MPDADRPDPRDCYRCQHWRTVQTGPHAFTHDCGLFQAAFPIAADCPSYQPGSFWRKPECPGLPAGWLEDWP